MSKRLGADITCPKCGHVFQTQLYRTIWIEEPENRALIINNKINAVTCPSCKHHERLHFPFLCTNVKMKFAIWYEPYHDDQIDKDVEDYRKHFGPNSFYARAPRIADWETFKAKMLEMEAAAPYVVGNEVELSDNIRMDIGRFVKSVTNAADKTKKKSRWWPF